MDVELGNPKPIRPTRTFVVTAYAGRPESKAALQSIADNVPRCIRAVFVETGPETVCLLVTLEHRNSSHPNDVSRDLFKRLETCVAKYAGGAVIGIHEVGGLL